MRELLEVTELAVCLNVYKYALRKNKYLGSAHQRGVSLQPRDAPRVCAVLSKQSHDVSVSDVRGLREREW